MNILIAGVGGQGTLLTSRLIAVCSLTNGLNINTSEVFGMSQRGGSVISHIRIGDNIHSSMIPDKEVDLLIGFEVTETARNIHKLKSCGKVLCNDMFIRPYSTKKQTLVEDDVVDYIKDLKDDSVFIKATKFAQEIGNPKVMNTILMGALAAMDILPFSDSQIIEAIKQVIKPKLIDINLRAFEKGYGFMKSGCGKI